MWQVEGGAARITLYGTVHALPPGKAWMSDAARAAFTSAGTLVVEIAGPPDPAAMRAVVMELGRLPVPVPLASRLPDDLKPKADALLKATGLPPGALDDMESWLAVLTLVQIEAARAGLDPAAGVDVALIARARAAGKPLVGLETPRGQFSLFDGLPEADQRLLLASAIADAGKTAEKMQELVAAWAAGDVERILKDFDDANLSPELEKRLFRDRNVAWADWVQTALKRPGRHFMAVGAAHMAGPHSLIAVLKARGFKVKRVQ
jgi:uncharacterized protein YbaP (TraB family)